MKFSPLPFALLGTLATLVACAQEPRIGAVEEPPIPTDRTIPGLDTPMPVKLVSANIYGTPSATQLRPYQALLAEPAALEGITQKMDPANATGPDLGDLIDAVKAGDGSNTSRIAPGLTGVGGIPCRLFLDIESDTLENRKYNPAVWEVEITDRRGQITAYEFGSAASPGRMTNEVFVTWVRRHKNGTVPDKTTHEAYRFVIEVDGGFGAVAKDPGNPVSAFPGTGLHIPQSMAANFDYKIIALGSGIRVVEVWYDRNHDGGFDPAEKIDSSNYNTGWRRNFRSLFLTHPENCIDMMVKKDPALPFDYPTTYAELRELGQPPQYCLGRCANPPLINTK